MTRVPGELPAAQDFYRLRREGVGHIEQAGSDHWTDYNTHDPGISILEALSYAITDLAYRTGFPIEDILVSADSTAGGADPYPDQTFYSARRILTVNPTSTEDFRRLLIDVDQVRNAWVRCMTCGCDTPLFAWCEDGEQVISDDPSRRKHDTTTLSRIAPQGLYDVLLELEGAPGLGDLNDRKIVRRHSVHVDGRFRPFTIEVRFPAWPLADHGERLRLATDIAPLAKVTPVGPNNTTTGVTPVTDDELRRNWFDVLYVDFDVELSDGTTIHIENASVRLYGDSSVRRQATVPALLDLLKDLSPDGFVEPYRRKLALTDDAVDAARGVLDAHRNLDEDYCRLRLVEIDDIAACAQIEVEPAADIELVQARIWFEIERYLDPPVDFWSLQDLRERGDTVDAIFNGPELSNGFLTVDGLADSALRTELRVSDIIDRLSDIEGVISVANLLLTAYDDTGSPIKGIADPSWPNGARTFDPQRTSAQWLLYPPSDHRTRLHHALSQFQFTSRGLPFQPRQDEAEATLVQLHGSAARPKLHVTELDLPVPVGTKRDLESYYPVQHSFPLTYGIGPAGLPSTATPQRQAQALQLKGYLMVYEQLLRNAYAQLAHAGDLFSMNPSVDRTYFSGSLDGASITDLNLLVTDLDPNALQALVESFATFSERRNRFLDHLLARFGESFGDYAMALTDLEGQGRARADLIHDKLAFLRALPRIGHGRGKALDRSMAPCDPDNAPGLHQRVTLLLGLPDWALSYRANRSTGAPGFVHRLDADELGHPVATFDIAAAAGAALAALITARNLDAAVDDWSITGTGTRLELTTVVAGDTSTEVLPADDVEAAALVRELDRAKRGLLSQLVVRERYTPTPSGPQWRLTVVDGSGVHLGETVTTFPTRRRATDFIAVMATWAAHKRAIVVEHLLLRPKFPGDALYPACAEHADCGGCCGGSDPYSFRLTYVMPGWTAPFATNLNMRAYADKTIQEQTPAHLLGKTCWVGNDGYITDPCDPMVDRLARTLADKVADAEDACSCAAQVYAAYSDVFTRWLDAHQLIQDLPQVLATTLGTLFDEEVELGTVSCADAMDDDLRADVQAQLVEHFVEIARHGYQFERFEDAWCAWAEAEAVIDWTKEQLQATVVELLRRGTPPETDSTVLCGCAAAILAACGTSFRDWMETNLAAGTAVKDFTAFVPPAPSCAGAAITDELAAEIQALLAQRYATYVEVSYRLHLLVRILGGLKNTYPRATLHDCDAGSDVNPVRLGHTALGSN
ncbi:hypothetical protein [Cellulomonas sp. URHE0023]|uniref:hypothetical protein n=1 Tax=Cellulomonas sp. URHE0023 TaxID=1380354 RepID=UPI00054D6031|nr:hypothetical protein [Cellulomonas sp. URHE0023]